MNLPLKIENSDSDFYEEYYNEYEEALKEFAGGGVEYSYSNGFEDEIYNYKQLIKFLGKNIITEEQETEMKIEKAWQEGNDEIGDQYAHVKRLREFTLHATFLSIHSMYEGRLKEICIIMRHFDRRKIFFTHKDNTIGIFRKLRKNIRLETDTKQNDNLRIFYKDIRNVITHRKGYLRSKCDRELIDKILKNRFLKLNACNLGDYDYRLQIKKSNFLIEYLNIIDEDLKIIYRAADKL